MWICFCVDQIVPLSSLLQATDLESKPVRGHETGLNATLVFEIRQRLPVDNVVSCFCVRV